MKISKHILLALVVVLLSGLGASAFAQDKRMGSAFRLPPEPIVGVTRINAIEVTDGVVGYDSQTKEETAFGYSFLGRTTGSYPGSFTLAMNCTPAIPAPGDQSQLTGGSWTLPVYITDTKIGGYQGALYGTVAKGTMTWDKAGTTATIYMMLNVDGGTQTWDGAAGFATFAGTLFVDEETHQTMLTGDLVFNMLGAFSSK